MSKSRTGLYLGLAAAGAGGYYLYRAGGNPKIAKQEMKSEFPLLSSTVIDSMGLEATLANSNVI